MLEKVIRCALRNNHIVFVITLVCMKEEETVMIRIGRETRLKLHRIKVPGETYDDLINKLIDAGYDYKTNILKESRESILFDKSGLTATINLMQNVIKGYDWISKGEWGSYDVSQRTTKTLQLEIGWCFDELNKIATEGLKESGNRSREWINEIDLRIQNIRS